MIKIFDLSLCKLNDPKVILAGIDAILDKSGLKSGEVSIDMAKKTTAHALQKMLKDESYFSVCTIQNCASALCLKISSPRMAIYNAAHCIRWGDMMPDYRDCLIAMVLDDFRQIFLPTESTNLERI